MKRTREGFNVLFALESIRILKQYVDHVKLSAFIHNSQYILKETQATPQPEAAPASTATPQLCASCGSPGHSRSTFRDCPFNERNVESEHGPQYQVACRMPFAPEHVFGKNICYTPGASYHRHVLPRMNRACSYCAAQMWIDERVKHSSVTRPRFGICCLHGKINLAIPRPPPAELLALLTNRDPSNETSNNFHTNIRAYNSMFAFASIQANYEPQLANGSNGVPTFRVNGTMYHVLGSLRAAEHVDARFAQIYFADAH